MNVASNRISGFGVGLRQFVLGLLFALFCTGSVAYAALPSDRSLPSASTLSDAATTPEVSSDAAHGERYIAPTQAKEGRNRLPLVNHQGDAYPDGAPAAGDIRPEMPEGLAVRLVTAVQALAHATADRGIRPRAPPSACSGAAA